MLGFVDEVKPARVRDQHLVAALFKQSARPGRVGSRLDRNAHGLTTSGKAPLEGFGRGAQSTLFEHFAAVWIEERQVGVPISQIQTDGQLRRRSATISHGPILSFL